MPAGCFSTEPKSSPAQNDGPSPLRMTALSVRSLRSSLRRRDQLVERLQRERVQLLRPGETDVRDPVGDGVGDQPVRVAHGPDVTGR